MKGILKRTYHFIDVDFIDVIDGLDDFAKEEVFGFNKGDEVEILKVVKGDHSYESKVAYVIFNPKNNESITLDSSLVDIVD